MVIIIVSSLVPVGKGWGGVGSFVLKSAHIYTNKNSILLNAGQRIFSLCSCFYIAGSTTVTSSSTAPFLLYHCHFEDTEG